MSETNTNKVTDAAHKSATPLKTQSREPNVIRNLADEDMEEEAKEEKPRVQQKGSSRGQQIQKVQIDEFKRLIGSKKMLHRAMTFQGKNNRHLTTLM